MILTYLKCPFCGSTDVGKYDTNNGKQRYICKNEKCSHKTFYEEYIYTPASPA
jgi:transposase-like protein